MGIKTSFTPGLLDALGQTRSGTKLSLEDPQTPGLRIEVLKSGLKSWRYRRRIRGVGRIMKVTLGSYPAYSIAAARKWERGLNDMVEIGTDPRAEMYKEESYRAMTVAKAHGLYMEAVMEGRSSRAKRPNRPRTITDKLKIFNRDIKPGVKSMSATKRLTSRGLRKQYAVLDCLGGVLVRVSLHQFHALKKTPRRGDIRSAPCRPIPEPRA
ncbi:Arm DNA-binding domain-containing protein [Sphingobium sp. HWE2-09]|uniref:Arm DNA-binding domain-containing protein n=1 Tax=Sphingobium sp. HWE2-09 TaxID=3108390 RepID=UPI002DCA02F6|nr:Arm DNA-binding domain-containing protein [Sphingobium sp. HWE2-09]